MKAVLCERLEGPGSLVIAEVAEPVAGPGQVTVRVKAAALNFFDTLITAGKYQTKPALPFSPCGEIAGVVESVGPGVSGLATGQRVMAYVGYGGAAEIVAVDQGVVVPLPCGVGFDVASGLAITYGTAIHGLKDRGQVAAGETVAVLGAAGGAGLAAVEIAKVLGARVIAAASSPEKLAVCRDHGADDVINTKDLGGTALKDDLRRLTGGRGVDVVYDCVGGALAEPAIRALAWRGRFLVVGFASGDIPRLPLNLLLVKGAAAIGVFWGDAVRRDPASFRDDMAMVLDAVALQKLNPHIHAVLPFTEVKQALAMLESRQSTGKIILSFE